MHMYNSEPRALMAAVTSLSTAASTQQQQQVTRAHTHISNSRCHGVSSAAIKIAILLSKATYWPVHVVLGAGVRHGFPAAPIFGRGRAHAVVTAGSLSSAIFGALALRFAQSALQDETNASFGREESLKKAAKPSRITENKPVDTTVFRNKNNTLPLCGGKNRGELRE
jgi:hypothetical protein